MQSYQMSNAILIKCKQYTILSNVQMQTVQSLSNAKQCNLIILLSNVNKVNSAIFLSNAQRAILSNANKQQTVQSAILSNANSAICNLIKCVITVQTVQQSNQM